MIFGLKQRQRRDVRMQRRDVRMKRRNVPENEAANVATLKLNVATFPRVVKTNVVTFQRGSNPTSGHSRGW